MKPIDQGQVKSCALIALVGILVYSNQLTHPFQFDSVQFISDNPLLKKPDQLLTWDYVTRNFFSRGGLFFTFGWNAWMGGMNPFGYHLVNLVFHLMNGLLVFFICQQACRYFHLELSLKRVGGIRSIAIFTALIFLCHPLQTESVTYIVSRSEVLAATFYLSAFYIFQICLDRKNSLSPLVWGGSVPVSILFLGLAGFSMKQSVATLPATLLLYYLLGPNDDTPMRNFLKRWKYVWAGLATLFLAGLFYKLFTDEAFLIGPSIAGEVIGRKNYMLTQPAVVVFYYLKLLLFPFNLNVDPDFPMIRSIASLTFWGSIGILLFILIGTFKNRTSKIYFFLAGWFNIVLSPSSSIVTLLDLAAEHRVYLGVFGFALFLTLGLARFFTALQTAFPNIKPGWCFPGLMILLIAILGTMTLKRNTVWKSELTLWHDAEKKSPHKARPLVNLGRSYTLTGQLDRSIDYYQRSLEIDSGFFQTHYNLAVLFQNKGIEEKALHHFLRAAVLNPDIPDTHGRLGEIYLRKKDFDRADFHLKRAVELNPKYAEAFRNLGALHFYELGQKKQGRVYLERSLMLNPNQQGADLIRQMIRQDN